MTKRRPLRKTFWHRLQHDDEGVDKLEDQYPLNTWLEIFLAWIGTALSVIAISLVIEWLGKLLNLHN